MELYQSVLLGCGLTLFVVILVTVLLKKDYLKYSKLITPVLKALNGVLKAVGNIFPSNKTISSIVTIISAGIEAAGYAENLWLQGEIDKTMRPQYAQQYIKLLLESAGIAINDSINTIIAGVIAVTCYLMPHYTETTTEGEE